MEQANICNKKQQNRMEQIEHKRTDNYNNNKKHSWNKQNTKIKQMGTEQDQYIEHTYIEFNSVS